MSLSLVLSQHRDNKPGIGGILFQTEPVAFISRARNFHMEKQMYVWQTCVCGART